MAHDEEFFTPEEQAQAEAIDQQIDARLRALPFLPPDRREDSDPLLIQKLARFYRPQAEEVQTRLQRARERVEQRSAHSLAQRQRKRMPLRRLRFLRERQDAMNNPRSLFHIPQRSSRLITIAASLLLTVLVGGLITGLILVRLHGSTTGRPTQPTATGTRSPQPTQTVLPSPTPTPGGTPGDGIIVIQMFDANTGWAITEQNKYLRTTDGANHWQNVTPSAIASQQIQGTPNYYFLSPSLAWIISATSDSGGQMKLLRTKNGGQTWTITSLQESGQIIFVNSDDGWMFSSQGGASVAGNAIDILRTIDGGTTWTKVASSGPATNNQPGVIPYSAYKSGIGALSASTAWVTGSTSASSAPWLYVTRDGGATWQQQTLGLPPDAPPDLPVITAPPTFFNAQDGVLPAFFSTTANSPMGYVYVTHDGGMTWRSTSIVAAEFTNGEGIDFLNVNQGWVSFRATLYVTSDGGQHWTKLPPSSALMQLYTISFISNDIGWASNQNLLDDSIQLLKTTDGGRTWTVVPLSIS